MKKHQLISNQLKADLLSGQFKVGDKLVGEHALSQRFNASRQTVRQALATLELEGYLERVHGSGTYVRRISPNDSQPPRSICVMTTYADTYIFPAIISGIEQILSESGYEMVLKLTRNNIETERTNLLSLQNSQICGLIVEGTRSAMPNPNLDLYRELGNLPMLFINSYYPELDPEQTSYIVVDDQDGAQQAVHHLIEQGHSRIGGIFKQDDRQGHDRYKGFAQAMDEADLPSDDSRILWFTTDDMQAKMSVENTQNLLNRFSGCTAVVCYNDQVTAMLTEQLAKSGKVIPQDLSIISFDDSDLARMTPPGITSMTHPGAELGKKAASSMLDLIENPTRIIQHTFNAKLISRHSVQNKYR